MVWQGQQGTELPSNWSSIRVTVLERDGWLCRINDPMRCTLRATDVDHIDDTEQGRANHDPSNLRAACRACHAYRSAMQGVAARPSPRRPAEQHPAAHRAAQTR